MKIKPPLVQINKDDPFVNDLLNRKPFADRLTNLIMNNKDELVIALNGQWGEGKTTFIKMWQAQLENEGFQCIYIDAFISDYTDDAFSTISIEIDNYIEANMGDNLKKEEFLNKSWDVTKRFLVWTGKVGVKALTLNVIGENEQNKLITEVKEVISNDVSNQFDSFTKDKLLAKQSKILFEEYKEALAEVAGSLASDANKPLIILIDELDRCKPRFSVQVLEKIKHFFSVKNIVFVLSANLEQLEHSIKSEYGMGIDATTYLQKFIDISATLPRYTLDAKSGTYPPTTDYQGSVEYYSRLLKHYDFINSIEQIDNNGNLIAFMMYLLAINRTSYRQSEKIMTNTKILISSFDSNNLNYTVVLLIILVSYLKTTHPNLIPMLYSRNISSDDIYNLWDFKKIEGSNSYEDTLNDLKKYISYCLDYDAYYGNEDFEKFCENTHFLGGGFHNRILILMEILDSFKIFDENSMYNYR